MSAMRKRSPSSRPVRTGRTALLQAVKDNPPMMTRATIPVMNSAMLGEKVRLEMLKFIYSGVTMCLKLLCVSWFAWLIFC